MQYTNVFIRRWTSWKKIGVNAEIQAGVKAPFILPLGLTVLAIGLVLGLLAVAVRADALGGPAVPAAGRPPTR